ncbi:hypothetical protein GCM10010984_29530 [Chishuiella changwenlii]|uniref:Uncharacterized protein n=1 Tax=Chishuiella changwenlii TaxID=1434701 RepID=A0ABQ1U4L4_9FLAO|nr:hypothetical protein GCM10010984_29530 [Chishuiella changwenlii]
MIYLIKKAPNKTDGIEKGTNQRNIFQFICFLKTAILDTELVNVPIVSEKGTTDVGNSKLRIGISIRLAPPPQIALNQNAKIVPVNNNIKFKIIFF